MSGGSYDYLYQAVDVGGIGALASRVETIERMRERLYDLGSITATRPARHAFFYASKRTDWVVHSLHVAEGWARFLSEPWKAVEWLDSSDWDHNRTADDVARWFLSDLPTGAGAGAVKNSPPTP